MPIMTRRRFLVAGGLATGALAVGIGFSPEKDSRAIFQATADSGEIAETNAMDVVSLAIRECGARHMGLYPLAFESQLKSRVNAFSGLRTPVWQRRRILIAEAA